MSWATPEACREISQGLSECNERNPWSQYFEHNRTPEGYEAAHHKCEGRRESSHPFRVRLYYALCQGLRSFHSLNPWLLSFHAFGVDPVLRVSHRQPLRLS